MSSTSKQGLIERRGLDTNELSEIKQHAQPCNQHTMGTNQGRFVLSFVP